jgi:anthranilate/para-aminobenzoate synthase component I
VVYDSVPEREFLEHQNKARALLTAIGQVRK